MKTVRLVDQSNGTWNYGDTNTVFLSLNVVDVVANVDDELHDAYTVFVWIKETNVLSEFLVDAVQPEILLVEERTARDSYNVFKVSPGVSPQAIVNGPVATNASPIGWLSGLQTSLRIIGNNVFAYLDLDSNNLPDAGEKFAC